jgi:leader peptidase (prepilin peptidase)/N-methyltransferase
MELFLVTLIGLCFGSFLNVAILRIPKGESINFPSSHCPTCKHPLKWYHNIPLFSWLFLRGKCAFCHTSISLQYPLIELLGALIFLIIFIKTPLVNEALLLGAIFALLLALSLIDLRYKAVPDTLSLPALFLSFFVGSPLVSFQNALLFMGGFTLLRFSISSIMKKEVMGEADIIIAGIIGALLGVKLGCSSIYLSAIIALIAFVIVRKKGYELPFIPFLSLGLFITWLFDTEILSILGMIYE